MKELAQFSSEKRESEVEREQSEVPLLASFSS